MAAAAQELPPLKFRNYFPRSEKLQEGVLTRVGTEDIEQQVSQILDEATDALDEKKWMAPTASKRNWDVKRDFHRKLAVLEKETDKAMTELIRSQILKQQAGPTAKEKEKIELEKARKAVAEEAAAKAAAIEEENRQNRLTAANLRKINQQKVDDED